MTLFQLWAILGGTILFLFAILLLIVSKRAEWRS